MRYPGLCDPAHDLAARQMSRFGTVVAFDLGSRDRAEAFLAAAELVTEATSFGGVHTTAERRGRWGGDDVSEGFIRLSAGIEDPRDLLEDVERALTRARIKSMPDWVGWMIAAGVLAVGEIFTMSFFLGPVAVAAAVAALASLIGAGLAVQIVVFTLASLASLLVLRPIARHHLHTPGQAPHGHGGPGGRAGAGPRARRRGRWADQARRRGMDRTDLRRG